MYLSRLYIENYRSIKKLDLKFEKGKNVIVGKNNSGKSNIIKAIDLILGERSPTWNKSDNISDNDFYNGESDKEILIWCEISIDQGEVLSLPDLGKMAFFRIQENYQNITIPIDFSKLDDLFYFCSDEGEAKLDDNSNGFRKYWIGGRSYCKKSISDELQEMHTFAFAFRCKKENQKYIKDLMFLYKPRIEDDEWYFTPSGNLRNELLQSAIIPSFRDPNSQLRITNYTWYGKLLNDIVKETPELKDAFAEVEKESNKIFDKLKNEISSKETQIAFPGTEISFRFNPKEQDLYKSTLIYVDDGFNSQLNEKGSGIQSAVIISLFDYYIRNIAHSGGSLLAIEEPEIYLHPHGRRVISDKLDLFLDGDKNQVIITTHSPEFICTPHKDINLIIVRKDTKTSAYNIKFDDVKTKQILIKKQNAEMFFADAVILTEGADKYILESIADKFGETTTIKINDSEKQLGKCWLNDYNVSIINCGGKDEFFKYAQILNSIEIPWFIMADFDFIREGLNAFFTKLGYDRKYSDTLNAIKSKISISGKYKALSQITNSTVKDELISFQKYLSKKDGIHILTGELENFYIVKPKHPKEAGVIETISKQIEEQRDIDEYIEINEFVDAFKIFIRERLDLELIEKADESSEE